MNEEDQAKPPCPKCGTPTKTAIGLSGIDNGAYTFCPKCKKVVSIKLVTIEASR